MNTVATPCMIAVPSILMVAPRGTEKPATLLFTPSRFSTVLSVTGKVAPDDDVEKAKAQTRRIFCRNIAGDSGVSVRKTRP